MLYFASYYNFLFNLMIKHLFNHLACSIMQPGQTVNAKRTRPAKWAKSISFWAKKEYLMNKKGECLMNKNELPHDHGETEAITMIQEHVSRVDNFQTVADIFKQLGDTTRVRIFWLLCHCEECVINISAMLKMSSPAVSHHLRPLKNSGLIVSRRTGKEVYYRAADTPQSQLLHQMIEQVMEIACPELQGKPHER